MLLCREELKQGRKSFFVWTLLVAAYNVFYITLFPAMSKNAEDLLKAYPESFLSAFDLDVLDMTHILGFYSMQGHLLVVLLGSVFASLVAASLLAKEESEKTIEFLYAKPIERSEIVTEKLAALITFIVLFNAVVHPLTFAAIEVSVDDNYSRATFWWLALGSTLTHATIGALCLFISSLVSKTKRTLALAMGVTFGSYSLDMIGKLSDKARALRYLSPFHYSNAGDIVQAGHMSILQIAVLISVSALAIAATYVVYKRKDLTG